ncbi:uncharacterized protein [Leptinotarsa decemlineata]|uniref:uncharacterized protein n=1 Tax=Leptinotarsa decemlineata TaxID=7539 RepID=UPI003D30A737
MEELLDSLMARDRGEVITLMGLLLDRLGLSPSELLRGSPGAAVRKPSAPPSGVKDLLERPPRKISPKDTPVNTTLTAQSETEKVDIIKPQEPANKKRRLLLLFLSSQLFRQHLDEASTEALAKGFNFAVAPGRIPVENIISNVESALNRIDDKETQESIRQDIAHVLKNAKPPTRNIPHKEYQALKNLRENEDIIILPADKGNATVVLNTIDYESKMMKLLEDPAYKKIVRDPTTYLEKTTKTAINNSPIDDEIKRHLIPREKSSKCPKLYGLPKVHKEGEPLRPIVSSVGSPVHQLAKHVAHVLQPHAEKVDSYVRNADHLIDILKTQTVSPDDILVSFDVTSLFTQVPTGEALEIIKKKYKPEEHIITLAEHCIKNTYFIYNDQRYRQIEGAPMGSPLSPVVANLFMEEIETEAIATSPLKPKLWLRYFDDIFFNNEPVTASQFNNYYNVY